jgi:DNA-binding response OmpR family regulator
LRIARARHEWSQVAAIGACEISGRTVESHVARLRSRLTAAGADEVLVNTWGHGWLLTRPAAPITRQLKR